MKLCGVINVITIAMKKTEQKIIKFIDSYELISRGDSVLVALSGGPDSVFMLHFLNQFKKRFNINLAALHVNHMLRDSDSDKDEKFCKKLCDDLDIQFYAYSADVRSHAKMNKQSIEEAARNLRYSILEKACSEIQFDKIATAHNSNDNTETVLLNLFHGTGLSGISGIPIVRGNIIRPLLAVSKEEILESLKTKGIKYRIDKSNKDLNFRRNFIRRKIVPLVKKEINPSLEDTILKSTITFRHGTKIIDHQTQKVLKKYTRQNKGELEIDLKVLEYYPEEILGDVLKKVLMDNFSHQFSFTDFTKITGLIKKQTGVSEKLSCNIIAYKERGKILVKRDADLPFEPVQFRVGQQVSFNEQLMGIIPVERTADEFSSSNNVENISADKLDDIFILRRWKPGDKFKPLGMKNFKKVSDFLNEQKIPASQKKNQLVLLNRNNIVWIVGLRIDDRIKIDMETKKIWRVWIK